MGPKRYKNRLLAYAEKQHASNAELDLVSVSVEVWAAQIDKLYGLANKGVHAEVLRSEARRRLIRTVLLLDDIVFLQPRPFVVKGHVNVEEIREMLLRWLRGGTV